jgi:hypothetical protein
VQLQAVHNLRMPHNARAMFAQSWLDTRNSIAYFWTSSDRCATSSETTRCRCSYRSRMVNFPVVGRIAMLPSFAVGFSMLKLVVVFWFRASTDKRLFWAFSLSLGYHRCACLRLGFHLLSSNRTLGHGSWAKIRNICQTEDIGALHRESMSGWKLKLETSHILRPASFGLKLVLVEKFGKVVSLTASSFTKWVLRLPTSPRTSQLVCNRSAVPR